jgi:hypothetical protein
MVALVCGATELTIFRDPLGYRGMTDRADRLWALTNRSVAVGWLSLVSGFDAADGSAHGT